MDLGEGWVTSPNQFLKQGRNGFGHVQNYATLCYATLCSPGVKAPGPRAKAARCIIRAFLNLIAPELSLVLRNDNITLCWALFLETFILVNHGFSVVKGTFPCRRPH